MKISMSSDAYHPLISKLHEALSQRSHELLYFGPKEGEEEQNWTTVTEQAIRKVVEGETQEAIVLCWTGTGCSILANKFPGIRAALCIDEETARGARLYNHANVLALSLRLTPLESVDAILRGWFETPITRDPWNLSQIEHLSSIESSFLKR